VLVNSRNSQGLLSFLLLFMAWIVLPIYTIVALAEGDMPNLGEARRLLEVGEAEQSIALLNHDLLRFAGNADYNYLLGLALYQAGHAGEALFAFERVIMVNPDNLAARLKAAQINLERGDTTHADELLAPLSEQRPDTEQQREIARMRAKIAAGTAGGGISVRGYVLTGIGWDSNVTSGPSQTELVIPQLSRSMTSLGTATRDDDLVGMVEVGLSLRKSIDEDTWLIGGSSIRQGFNSTRRDMKEGAASLDLGAIRRIGHNFLGVTLLAQDYLLGDATYRNSLGTRLNWIHPLEDHSKLTIYFQHLNFVYHQNIDNAIRKVGGVTYEFTMNDGAKTLQYGVYGGEEDAKDPSKPNFSFRLLGVHLAGNLHVSDDLSLSAGAIYELHHHLAEDGLYSITRHDAQFSVGASADYHLSERRHLIPLYTHTLNVSNVDLYKYSRNTVMLQFKWEFDK